MPKLEQSKRFKGQIDAGRRSPIKASKRRHGNIVAWLCSGRLLDRPREDDRSQRQPTGTATPGRSPGSRADVSIWLLRRGYGDRSVPASRRRYCAATWERSSSFGGSRIEASTSGDLSTNVICGKVSGPASVARPPDGISTDAVGPLGHKQLQRPVSSSTTDGVRTRTEASHGLCRERRKPHSTAGRPVRRECRQLGA